MTSAPPTTTALEALRRHITARVMPRDRPKAERLLAAADLLPDLQARPLDVAVLVRLATAILGSADPPLRTMTAWAHGGRARMRPFSTGELAAVVADADVFSDGPAWFRAGRLYADLCFFHPFDDGNARLALCALVLVLQREGVAVVDLGPLVMPWTPSSASSLLRVARGITVG